MKKKILAAAAGAIMILSASGCSTIASMTPEEKREAAKIVITVGMTAAEMFLRNGEPDMVVPIQIREPGSTDSMRRYQYGDTIAITRNGKVVRVYKAKSGE